jgi:dimethylhistidine N-methyltransferase
VTELLEALGAEPRSIPVRYLYDARGAELFEEICEVDEYYITRTELGILRANGSEMAQHLGAGCLLIEFGSGAGEKIRVILDQRQDWAGYVPIDIAEEQLVVAARSLGETYPGLEVLPVCADFNQEIALPEPAAEVARRVVFFPGSTIGNFDRPEARAFLERMAGIAGAQGGILIGVDLDKDPSLIEAAYDDRQGVSAEFALNALEHLNRELKADFEPSAFRYRSRYDTQLRRVEMGLVSQVDQVITLGGERIALRQGEFLRTEYSCKFTLESFRELAAEAGLTVEKVWTDEEKLFSVQMLRVP